MNDMLLKMLGVDKKQIDDIFANAIPKIKNLEAQYQRDINNINDKMDIIIQKLESINNERI